MSYNTHFDNTLNNFEEQFTSDWSYLQYNDYIPVWTLDNTNQREENFAVPLENNFAENNLAENNFAENNFAENNFAVRTENNFAVAREIFFNFPPEDNIDDLVSGTCNNVLNPQHQRDVELYPYEELFTNTNPLLESSTTSIFEHIQTNQMEDITESYPNKFETKRKRTTESYSEEKRFKSSNVSEVVENCYQEDPPVYIDGSTQSAYENTNPTSAHNTTNTPDGTTHANTSQISNLYNTQSVNQTTTAWTLNITKAKPVKNGDMFVRPYQGDKCIFLDFFKHHNDLFLPPIITKKREPKKPEPTCRYTGEKWSIVIRHYGNHNLFPALLYRTQNSPIRMVTENIPDEHLDKHGRGAKDKNFKVGSSFGLKECYSPIIGQVYTNFVVSPTISTSYLKNGTLYFALCQKSQTNVHEIEQMTQEFSIKIVNSTRKLREQWKRNQREQIVYDSWKNVAKKGKKTKGKKTKGKELTTRLPLIEDEYRKEIMHFQSIEGETWGCKENRIKSHS